MVSRAYKQDTYGSRAISCLDWTATAVNTLDSSLFILLRYLIVFLKRTNQPNYADKPFWLKMEDNLSRKKSCINTFR